VPTQPPDLWGFTDSLTGLVDIISGNAETYRAQNGGLLSLWGRPSYSGDPVTVDATDKRLEFEGDAIAGHRLKE
jgi:hypothetical protein